MKGLFFDAEAHAALQRAAGHVSATDAALAEAVYALDNGDDPDLPRQVEKARELHRLFSVRLASITRRLAEGAAL